MKIPILIKWHVYCDSLEFCMHMCELFIFSQHAPLMYLSPWWRHQMEIFSALLAICAGNSPVPGEFPSQVTRSFAVFFDLRPNKRLSKQWWGWRFETLSSPLWRHFYAKTTMGNAQYNDVMVALTFSPKGAKCLFEDSTAMGRNTSWSDVTSKQWLINLGITELTLVSAYVNDSSNIKHNIHVRYSVSCPRCSCAKYMMMMMMIQT